MDVNLLDPSENYLWFGCTPKKIINFLNGNLLSDSVFIDCGTNIGIWSIIACESIKGKGTVHSFEPNPLLYKRLKRNLNYNHISEYCTTYNVALSSDSKTGFLYLDDTNHQMASLVKGNEKIKKLRLLQKRSIHIT